MSNPVLTDAIDRLARGQDLTADEAARVLREVMEGNASEAETAGFLIALRTKGETVDEIAGLAATMRALALRGRRRRRPGRHRRHRRRAAHLQRVDHRGVRRRGGRLPRGQARQPLGHQPVRVGRRARGAWAPASTWSPARSPSASRRSASASCSRPSTTRRCGTWCPVRRALGVRTIFNFLGPLTNPAGAKRQVIGVSDPDKLETLAAALGATRHRVRPGSVERRWT